MLGNDIIDKMSKLGVICDIQPSFVGTDSAWVRKRLPGKIHKTSYCWKTLMRKGIVCAGGSDAPIETWLVFFFIIYLSIMY